MFTLRLFGGVALEGPSGPVGGRVTQRGRLAVLALLGASETALSRPKILGLLWPDIPEDRGRHLLSDTLYVARAALGEDALLISGDEVRLNRERIRVDVRAFRQALDEERREEAVELYLGPFLDGFYVSGSPDFEKWTDVQRRGLSELYGSALEGLATAAEAEGRVLDALKWWKRRAGHEPLNSRVAVRLMRAHAAAGNTAGALGCARAHRRLLQEEFAVAPPEEFVALEEELSTPALTAAVDPAGEGDGSAGEKPASTASEPIELEPPGAELPRLTTDGESRPVGAIGGLLSFAGAVALLLLGVVLAGGWLTVRAATSGGESDPEPLDPSAVTILPFRTSGVTPSLAFLGEGMVDLLAAKLTGEGGPRAADPRAVLGRWRQAGPERGEDGEEPGFRIARELRSGRLLTGSVVGNEERLVLTATFRDVASGDVRSRANVHGGFGQLMDMVDRLVAQILVQEAGESERRLTDLTTRSLPALREYLEGLVAYRQGRPDHALARFSRAVEVDSSFALAALNAHLASTWIREAPPFDAFGLAWRHRERLSDRDRLFLAAETGPNYPGRSTGAEMLAARKRLVRTQSDNPEAWFALGDFLVHFGAFHDMSDSVAVRRATSAFDRALALDSTFLPALNHLFDVARGRGDTASARQYGNRYLARAPSGLQADVIRNLLDLQSRGLAALPDVLTRMDTSGGDAPRLTLMALHRGARTLPSTDAIVDQIAHRVQDSGMAPWVGWIRYGVAMDRGRPTDASRSLEALERTGHLPPLRRAVLHVRDGLHQDGSDDVAARSANEIAVQLSQSPDDINPVRRVGALCVLGQWRLTQGEAEATPPIIDGLRTLGGDGESIQEAEALGCAQVLGTWRAAELNSPDARSRVARLDSLLASGTLAPGRLKHEANLVLARLLERQDDLQGALRVLGRYPRYVTAVQYRSTFLRERGRVASLVGDTAAAIDAYRRYLTLRTDPEPALRPEVERVRGELAKLEGHAH